ncbi:sigma factor-like helix-turn-helix DNA-binding protein [Bacillus cereus]|uniref:Sigma-70 family RNA polymerase sigma factor n=1 Tax=Bacillus cereus TaxID=1396 RepID=A0ABD7RIQ9_BACCE|nr:sigma factor-like helix-turn-helix DNA-binding protein [Bacillus cereus]MDF9625230.1 sigma factor-like helix-turn-helix DNA-binding protein [Bacillus cereus]MEB9551587.1 sigma factor-like helix-turn-helix DNA-binding protein [Bacillus cereus]MEB9568561.1 sigma factor-like helix-turn-helix DNA-binding protein [Bacillus cereus]TNB99965.1 sigma-70 family RNA polymerase sigma factor [Bacillus cereus]
MGVSKYDNEAAHRCIEQNYALDNPKSIDLLLRHLPYMQERRFNGDYAAPDILIDLGTAISNADLTDRQRQVLRLVYFEDMKQRDVAISFGITAPTANLYKRLLAQKIAAVFESWARKNEGYSLTVGA